MPCWLRLVGLVWVGGWVIALAMVARVIWRDYRRGGALPKLRWVPLIVVTCFVAWIAVIPIFLWWFPFKFGRK